MMGNGMDVETSLSWRGPYWYVGRCPIRQNSNDIARDQDIALMGLYERSISPPDPLPAAIIIDIEEIHQEHRTGFFEWLTVHVRNLPCDVPFYILTGSEDELVDGLRPIAILERTVPDDILVMLICIHQRALMRSEEARIRRRVFGRVPGFGAAPHYSGGSGLMVVGVSGRFLEWQAASNHNVEVVGAFDGGMATEFMAQRAFDAVVIDSNVEDTIHYMQQIRRDARFASLPVMAVCEYPEDVVPLFRNGASDVLLGRNHPDTLNRRLASAIRLGKRRRLADRVLSESHMWLQQQITVGGLDPKRYEIYLETTANAMSARGLDLWEMRLTPENFNLPAITPEDTSELNGTLLSVADATSRDEDLVCLVRGVGPVAVLKNEAGTLRLQKRIHSILAHTVMNP